MYEILYAVSLDCQALVSCMHVCMSLAVIQTRCTMQGVCDLSVGGSQSLSLFSGMKYEVIKLLCRIGGMHMHYYRSGVLKTVDWMYGWSFYLLG